MSLTYSVLTTALLSVIAYLCFSQILLTMCTIVKLRPISFVFVEFKIWVFLVKIFIDVCWEVSAQRVQLSPLRLPPTVNNYLLNRPQRSALKAVFQVLCICVDLWKMFLSTIEGEYQESLVFSFFFMASSKAFVKPKSTCSYCNSLK